MAPSPAEAVLIYDGDCPVCSSYVRYLRIKESVGKVDFVNAREPDERVEDVVGRGLDLNEGMVLVYGGRYYHGADCVHMLALLSTPSGVFNRLNATVFRSPLAARLLYPVLRAGRNALLAILGRQKLDHQLKA